MSTLTPNMNLIEPTIGTDTGLTWEQSFNSDMNIIDQHDHTPGWGVPIVPAGININSDLTFSNNSAINLKACVFTAQSSFSTIQSLYVMGVDLYFNDGSSNVVRITSGGLINATSSGISSGTASASFVGSVLVVNADTNKPANIQAGSILLGNNVTSSKYLTLQPPNAMAANYTLTLPSIPASQSFMSIDNSGNMAAYVAVSGGLTGSNIAAATITGSNIAAATISASNIVAQTITNAQIATNTLLRTNMYLGGQVASSSSGSFTTTSNSFVNVTNLTVTITVTGRPVMLVFNPTSTGGSIKGSGGSDNTVSFKIIRTLSAADTTIAAMSLPIGTNVIVTAMPASLNYVDFGLAAGTYSYRLQVSAGTGALVAVSNIQLVAYEL